MQHRNIEVRSRPEERHSRNSIRCSPSFSFSFHVFVSGQKDTSVVETSSTKLRSETEARHDSLNRCKATKLLTKNLNSAAEFVERGKFVVVAVLTRVYNELSG